MLVELLKDRNKSVPPLAAMTIAYYGIEGAGEALMAVSRPNGFMRGPMSLFGGTGKPIPAEL